MKIKFRAWDKKQKFMLYNGFSITWSGSPTVSLAVSDNTARPFSDPHDLVPMQYTGRRDKNGWEMFEGDIVEQRNDLNMLLSGPYEIRWGQFGFTLHSEDGPENHYITPRQLVVIGNIYQSPELIEGVKKMSSQHDRDFEAEAAEIEKLHTQHDYQCSWCGKAPEASTSTDAKKGDTNDK